MTRVALTGGAYTAKTLIAQAQRCVNLYPEANPPADSPFPVTHYLTPGLRLLATPAAGPERLEYVASNGKFYRVIGGSVYYVASDWTHTLIGIIAASTSICSMSDNGVVAVLVDGTPNGYAIDLASNAFGQIFNLAFYGADRVDYLDGFFLFNWIGTPNFYISLLNVTYADLATPTIIIGSITAGGSDYINGNYTNVPFTGGSGTGATALTVTVTGGSVTALTLPAPGSALDYAATDVLTFDNASLGGSGSGFEFSLTSGGGFNSLDVGTLTGGAGNVVTLIVAHRNIVILKDNNGEPWYDTAAADFVFGPTPGVIIEHGIAAKYSLCAYDGSAFWLGRDKGGTAIVFQYAPLEAKRISTHAIEYALTGYSDISDAVAFIYQNEGHAFYCLSFPSADKTWVFDLATQLWHERAWIDGNGQEHRMRAGLGANAYGLNVVGDWQTGKLYHFDSNTANDNGSPIVRRRGFPHLLSDGDRVLYRQFIAELDAGNPPGLLTTKEPQVSLRWSDDRGHSWGSPMNGGMGSTGQYLRCVQWQRLGMARDRVFELFWSTDAITALNGAYVESKACGT